MIKPVLLWIHTLCTSCLPPKGQQLFSTSVSLMILETLWWYCMCVSMCLWTLVHLCVCVSLSFCVTVCIYFSVCGAYLCMYLFVVCVSVCVSILCVLICMTVSTCMRASLCSCVYVCLCILLIFSHYILVMWGPWTHFPGLWSPVLGSEWTTPMPFGVRAALCVDIVLKSMFG